MSIFRQSITPSFNCILICHLIILKLCLATNVDSIVSNGEPAASSSLSETLEFSDSVPGFEHHEFQSLRIKPLSTDKLAAANKSTITKVTTSATLAATLLKKVGLPSTSKYDLPPSISYNTNSNKTILNSVLIKRISRQPPTSATLIANNLIATTQPTYDETDLFKKQTIKANGLTASNGKLLRISKKKKAKQSPIFKSSNYHFNSSSLLLNVPTSTPLTAAEIENSNELTSSSLAPNAGVQATEQISHSVMINHGGGAVSTIRRTSLNSGPSFEHLQIGFPNNMPNGNFANEPFLNNNFGNIDLTPPPLPQLVNNNNNNENNNNNNLPPPSQSLPKAIQQPRDDEQSLPPSIAKPIAIYSSNRNNGRLRPLRGAHKKQLHVNRRKSAALVKDNELNNQIVPVSVGIPNTFQNSNFKNVRPQDLPNFAELSFFGYRSDPQDTPRLFNEREHYTTNNNNNNLNKPFNHHNNNENNFNSNNLPPPPPPPIVTSNNQNHNNVPSVNNNNNSPRNEFNFNLHPFFSNERRNPSPPNNNDFYQFFDTPFMPVNPSNVHNNLNSFNYHTNHQTMHHHNGDNHQLNHQIFHHNPPALDNELGNNNSPLHPINTPNGQFFQRRKLTLSNGNAAPAINEISNNNLGYGYPSYNVYKGDEDAKWPKIFKFTDGRVNLNDFEKEKKLGKIEFGKGIPEDGSEYTFEHVRRDLFLILHGGSFNY